MQNKIATNVTEFSTVSNTEQKNITKVIKITAQVRYDN